VTPKVERLSHAAPARPSLLAFDLAVIRVLWKRDLVRFFRQRSRIVGALAQPLIFWAMMGSGFAPSFRIPGAEGVGYMQYFFPGIVTMTILFTAIFSTMSLIEDRREGFMQAILAGPGSRTAAVLGKVLGSTSLAILQAGAVLLLAPLAGYSVGAIAWPLLVAHLLLASIALCGIGFAFAWWLNSTAAYHAVMSVVLLPAWILSGAMFPMTSGPGWMRTVVALNPLSYAATGVRRALAGGSLPQGLASSSTVTELSVAVGMAVFGVAVATWVCARNSASS